MTEANQRRQFDPLMKDFAVLADEAMESVSPSNDGRYAIGADNRAYRIMSDYDPGQSDYYLVNTNDGVRKLVGQKQRFGATLSPGAISAASADAIPASTMIIFNFGKRSNTPPQTTRIICTAVSMCQPQAPPASMSVTMGAKPPYETSITACGAGVG